MWTRAASSARVWRTLAFAAASLLLAACSTLPRDNAGSLARVTGGELRAGVADHAPWVLFDGERTGGLEADVLQGWAGTLGARVVWRRGAEAELVEALARREIDVLAAGLDANTPHAAKLGLTQTYFETRDEHGVTHKHVLAVTQGESALLFALDRFLASLDPAALDRRARELSPLVIPR